LNVAKTPGLSEGPLKPEAAMKEVPQGVVAWGRVIAIEGPAVNAMGGEGPGIGEGIFEANPQCEVVGAIVAI